MQQKKSAETIFSDMQSNFKDVLGNLPSTNPFDFKALFETQRKNFQALTEANQRAFQGWQSLAQRQAEMLGQFVQDNSGLARETMGEGTPQSKFAKQAEIIKSAYEKSVLNTQELTEIMRKCSVDTAEVLNRRVVASIAELKNSTNKE